MTSRSCVSHWPQSSSLGIRDPLLWGQSGDAGWQEQNVVVPPLWECVLHENTMRKGVGEYLFSGLGVSQEPVIVW